MEKIPRVSGVFCGLLDSPAGGFMDILISVGRNCGFPSGVVISLGAIIFPVERTKIFEIV